MTKNFAHRGFSGKYPENTRIAFEKAIACPGCDGIENDVHLTSDGEVVIIHDEKLDRTSTNMKGYVKDYTLDELRRADLSYTYAGKVEPQTIMTLEEYLQLLEPTKLVTNIELKTGVFEYEGIEQKVADLIRKYDMADRIIISSFNHYSCRRMKAIMPEIPCGLLVDAWILEAGKYVKDNGFEYYHPEFHNCTAREVLAIKDYGVGINAWTINEEKDIRSMLNLGIDTIIGNYPDLVTKVRMELDSESDFPMGWTVCGWDD